MSDNKSLVELAMAVETKRKTALALVSGLSRACDEV